MNFLTRIFPVAAILLLSACASSSTQKRTVTAADACAPNETLVCEVSNTGRIKHGSFSKDGERCSCSDRSKGPPIIPGVP